ncbi:MAG: imidazole glycerol phosphate synthase subunit HisH [Dehalococcoidia bacterium]|nr:imidazole glycerol phosphate synthase subunit HisH [Dehalococcoidia bacterium]
MIAVIDYGAGNLRSVVNALNKLGYSPKVTNRPDDVLNANTVIFPGVGAAADTMHYLKEAGLDEAILEVIHKGRPFLAICLGMQVLLSVSEEDGHSDCLSVIPGVVRRLPEGLKVPHMGWNQVKQMIKHPIFDGIPDEANFYFVHSYYAEPQDTGVIAGTTEYGVSMCSMIVRDNVIATQFHPEKSGELGLRMYDNFLKMAGVKR